jgi:hypothetical protein
MLFHEAVREFGGVRVHKTVSAEGYLKPQCEYCGSAWSALIGTAYKYIEVEALSADPLHKEMIPQPGFYEFRLYDDSADECHAAELPAGATRHDIKAELGLRHSCVIAIRRNEPISRYEVSHSVESIGYVDYYKPVALDREQVVDRLTHEIIAEACKVSFHSWLGGHLPIGVANWQYSDDSSGKTIELRIADVVKPALNK